MSQGAQVVKHNLRIIMATTSCSVTPDTLRIKTHRPQFEKSTLILAHEDKHSFLLETSIKIQKNENHVSQMFSDGHKSE